MGDNDNEEKIKLSRAELLAKARKVKAEKAIERQKIINNANANANANDDVDKIISSLDNQSKPPPKTFIKKPSKKKDITVEIKELKLNKNKNGAEGEAEGEGPELVEEVVRVPANRRKKIIKRTIEIEESETDEEVIEEIVKIPKSSKTTKKEVKINKDDIKKKLIEDNKQRLLNELFS